ncbi:MAG TPA: carboxypeptidase-like regulatory domain-containing protein, partial [Blastocatellia bacterium]|nr:carboxypeptidase-like regulatory domain-containing protein [Blastocatellia bacterium]
MKSKVSFSQMGMRIYAICILMLFAAATGYAQFDTATVLGTVRDAGGAVMPGVNVTLKNIDTSIAVNAQTDADGNFQFTNVRIGNYRVSAEKSGFSTAVAERV